MKIGTLTTHMADNYGAVLQAYALPTYLGMRADCEIINYYPDYLYRAYHKKMRITSPKALINFAFQTMFSGQRAKRSQRFEAFRAQHMPLSPIYRTSAELAQASGAYDAIVAGSDQIWNPEIHGFDEAFFLTFCGEGVSKNGYAPSFGISSLNEAQAAEVRRRCEGFDRLAFREESGVRIARDVLARECPLVLDPVFLPAPEEWERLCAPVQEKKKYVLCYFLSDPRGSVSAMCRRFKKQGYEIISIGFSARDIVNGAKKRYDLGPSEFLAYVRGAEYILTDSFHATAFSVIFGKNFYTRVDGKNAKRADRVLSLLRAAGLSDRTYADADAPVLPFTPIDHGAAMASLAPYVEASRAYADGIVDNVRLRGARCEEGKEKLL